MRRNVLRGVMVALIAAAALPALVKAQGGPIQVDGHYADAADDFLYGGGKTVAPNANSVASPEMLNAPGTAGNLWDNGKDDLVNGLTSERRTFTTGTDGPQGDWVSAIADDFNVPGLQSGGGPFTLTEVRACMASNPTEDGMWIYATNAGNNAPALPITSPLFGGSNSGGAPLNSKTFTDGTSRCAPAFGLPGREFQFNSGTTGATMPTLANGDYWLVSVAGSSTGGAAGGRGFWYRSDNSAKPLGNKQAGVVGSTIFGFAYWTTSTPFCCRDYTFDIDGQAAGGVGGKKVDPNRQLGKQVHLPILNFQGQDDVCRTWIEVQVIGPEFSKAVLVTWGEPGFCPPQCAGPLKVECTGLLKPGSTWNFLGAQIPTGSKGGMLFKFTSKQISEIDPTFVGEDDIVADYMCEQLFFGVVGDCDDYRRFKKAYNEGLDFQGLSMQSASGAGFLAVDVLRHCPGDVTPGVEVSGKYNGIAGDHLGAFDPVYGGYGFYVPLLYASKAGFNSIMYIQNGGLECSSVEIWFKAQDDCLRARICEIFTLAPGETYQFDASDCVGPDWQGSAWLRSTQPLGIVVDIIGRDVLMTYVGEPAAFDYPGNPLLPATDPASKDRVFSGGDQVAFGPLMYSEYQGWDTGVQVQNLSPVVNAKVKVYFLDRSGDIITTLVDWICPRGSQTYFLPVIADLPGNWVGSIRVESQEWWTPGSPAVAPPDIVGVATLIKYNDAARSQTTEAIAYNLLPEHKIYIWQIGSDGGGTVSGVGLIAIPSLLKDLEGTGVTSEVAIANVVPKPGFTDFAIFIYDQNGLLDYVCQKLNQMEVEYINLQTWGYVNPGFKGSAIISAVFWEHDVFGDVPATPNPTITADLSVGVGAPPAKIGSYTMVRFPGNTGNNFQDTRAQFTLVSSVPAPAPFSGSLGFNSLGAAATLSLRNVGSGWSFWSNGYTGSVYFAGGGTPTFPDGQRLTMTMPAGVGAFFFYIEPNNFNPTAPATSFIFTAFATDGTTAQVSLPNGIQTARYIGFSADAATGATLKSIDVACTTGNCGGFAVGEFGIGAAKPVPTVCCGFIRNLVGLGAVAVERSGTRLGEDVPGDEAAGDRGIPFAAAGRKGFDWEGPNLPDCPGIGRTKH